MKRIAMPKPVEDDPTVRWYWLSYADPNRPPRQQFLGVAIVPVTDAAIETIEHLDQSDGIELLRGRGQFEDVHFYVAVQIASLANINPGGEVQGFEISANINNVPKGLRMRLLSREQLKAAGL